MRSTMAVHVLLSTIFILTSLRWCTAAEMNKDSQPVTRTMNQLRSILAFLPRAQKCDKLLFDLMKECVDEGNVAPALTTTRPPERREISPISIRAPPVPSAPADDEDSSVHGSGLEPASRLLPERASTFDSSPVRPQQPPAWKSGRTNGRKSKKNKKKNRLLKLKKVGLKRTLKLPRRDKKQLENVPTYTTVSGKRDSASQTSNADFVKPKQDSKDPTNMRAHSPEFFKYMGMG